MPLLSKLKVKTKQATKGLFRRIFGSRPKFHSQSHAPQSCPAQETSFPAATPNTRRLPSSQRDPVYQVYQPPNSGPYFGDGRSNQTSLDGPISYSLPSTSNVYQLNVANRRRETEGPVVYRQITQLRIHNVPVRNLTDSDAADGMLETQGLVEGYQAAQTQILPSPHCGPKQNGQFSPFLTQTIHPTEHGHPSWSDPIFLPNPGLYAQTSNHAGVGGQEGGSTRFNPPTDHSTLAPSRALPMRSSSTEQPLTFSNVALLEQSLNANDQPSGYPAFPTGLTPLQNTSPYSASDLDDSSPIQVGWCESPGHDGTLVNLHIVVTKFPPSDGKSWHDLSAWKKRAGRRIRELQRDLPMLQDFTVHLDIEQHTDPKIQEHAASILHFLAEDLFFYKTAKITISPQDLSLTSRHSHPDYSSHPSVDNARASDTKSESALNTLDWIGTCSSFFAFQQSFSRVMLCKISKLTVDAPSVTYENVWNILQLLPMLDNLTVRTITPMAQVPNIMPIKVDSLRKLDVTAHTDVLRLFSPITSMANLESVRILVSREQFTRDAVKNLESKLEGDLSPMVPEGDVVVMAQFYD